MTDTSTDSTDPRRSFRRHLPRRIDAVARRIARFEAEGWDINGLSVLHADAQRLAGASGRHGLVDASELLLALESLLGRPLADDVLPEEPIRRQISAVVARLTELFPASEGVGADDDERHPVAAIDDPGDRPAGPPPLAVPTVRSAGTITCRVYYLSAGDDFGREVEQQLAIAGLEVETLVEAEELREVLSALPPDLVLIGPGFEPDLAAIGNALLPARQRSGTAIPLVVLAATDSIESRLSARRAHADALLFAPLSPRDVVQQVEQMLNPEREPPFRVLIVEDDRSQGVFAESILRNAGMDARVVEDPMQVLPVMAEFNPDLLLMDLHMPKANGMELTALIREREEFLNTPIVFLSGESDEDVQFEALEAGGDDFIAKPVRPRHLIAAVQNRVRRARAAGRSASRRPSNDPNTGLHRRSWLLERIDHALDAALAARGRRLGGLLYLDIEGTRQIRERLGLSALETLLANVGRLLADAIAGVGHGCRLGDSSFLVLCPAGDGEALEALAKRLRRVLAEQVFEVEGRPLRLRCTVGVCAFEHGFADAGALLTAVERACRQARGSETGVKRFEPPKGAEREHEEALLDLLRHAIERRSFELLFQPIVAVQGSEEAQYQTLLRLRDDAGRVYPAATLVPLAERAGLLVEIDRWAINHALDVIAERHRAGRRLRLFVPQSAPTLLAPGQIEWLRQHLAQAGLGGSCVVLEMRMGDAIIQADALLPVFRQLAEFGCQVCLSQFERVPEAVRLINELPLGYAKLAGRYIEAGSAATQNVRDELRLLIDELHGMNVKVVGHRVEDAQAAATLWMSGIDLIQGNLVQQAGSGLEFDFDAAVL